MLVFPSSEPPTRMGSMLSHQRQLRLLLSILVLLSPRLPVRSTPADIVERFHDPEVKRMNHLVVDKNTGRVYVGAVNRLYQLSPDLSLVVKEVTGPKGDSPACSMIDCPRETPTRLVDNVNMALVIDYTTTRLIACGTLSQGTCSVRNLQNISTVELEVKEAVVANNASMSTVAFIAPGPPNPPVSQVMYVGVTFTGNSPYRSEVPAVSSRSLDQNKMLNIAQSAVTTGTRMYVNSLSRERYRINYVYGFSSGGFSYFMTTQMKNTNSPAYLSKLVRICHDDQHYYSYTEIPINCTKNDVYYNLVQAAYVGKAGSVLAGDLGITAQDDVLFAVFAESNGTNSDVPKPHSALCVYSLKAIRRKFMTNIQKCFSGEGHRGLEYISPSHQCILTKLQTISEDFCGLDVNTPLGGEDAMNATSVLTFDTHLTAVAATSTGDYTVVFLGTRTGHLKKVVVESSTVAQEYGELEIDLGSVVNADLLFDSQLMHLYVMTNKTVSKVKVQECSVYKTCWDCLGAKDPYCGWCSLENKCNLRSDCQDAAKDPLYWISYKSGRCITITTVTPDQLQRTTARTLELVIENLPTLPGQFRCAFSTLDKTLITNASRKSFGVNCTTPRTDLLPSISQGQHHFTAKLSVRMTNGPDLVATNFTFFDCNTYSSCTQCVSSRFPCDWCVDGHRCTHDTAENCRNDILVTGVSRTGPSYRSGPAFCPTLNATESAEILVSSGIKQSIRVKVHIIGQFIVQTRFVCQFNIEGRVTSVNARLLGDTIYCEDYEFSYTSRAPNITVPFAVIWGGSKPLDNPHNIHLVIYRCRDMADNCGMCLALATKYNCGWCQSSDRCEVKKHCDNGTGIWLNSNETCPNPEIHMFEPVMGPWEGNTNVTIRGINLGKTFSDIYKGVMVGGMRCLPYEELYMRTKQIVCRVDGPGTIEGKRGPVIVEIEDFRGQSEYNFEFVDPKILSISPEYGPVSGGTTISITGKYMNAGSTIEAFIDELPCSIINADTNYTLCVTSASDRKRNGQVKMTFDGAFRIYDGYFKYVDDPTIESVESGVASQMKIPKGIPAGGIKMLVTGKNLDCIQRPQMYVYYDKKMFVSQCKVHSQETMVCKSPTIEVPDDVVLDGEKPLPLEYGFRMDNVTGVQNLSQSGFNSFLLYPNPIYEQFGEEIKYYKSEYLTINGLHIDRACQESDVTVQIGNAFCNVTSLSRQQLTCRPPLTQPPAIDSEGLPNKQELPDVIVIVGGTLRYNIGKLSYELPAGLNGPSKPALIGVIAAIVILVFVFIAFLIAYRRKSTESNRVLKNMQEQMDILELRVAAECKEAFAELQTEMTDLTGDLTSGGIPFLDYRTYAMMILFPSDDNSPVLQWDRPELVRKEKGLRLFGQLIMNKTFLLLFVRTLESNRYFSMRDRVNVASLIMVTLQSKMEYCTDILKTLLAELIEKCTEGKSHPKLFLRRTESVAEKMLSAWFTFLLYKFMRECAGEPLYVLFRAVKQQVDKGPVDAITSEARYSLSEEKLIRQSIDFKPMTVYVSISQQTVFVGGMDPNTENVPVKVLDCDTISQVKEKALDTIYRATPYSQRPRKDDLDLEWRTGASGRLILYDEDSTTKTEGEWKKRNTLNHYRVPDGASLNLVSKQSSIYNLSILSEKTDKSHKYETLNLSKFSSASPPLSRATSPLNQNHDGGLKCWHLVKHHDSDARKEGDRGNKMVSEIYLTRLLATKGTLQKFVDDLFETIFSTAHRGSALPLAIKYMFDFMDDQALQHGISDPEVVHTWKSNSLPLRFWVNLIKNPNFIFDIHKSNIVDSCLSVVAQTFMDSCSTSDHRLGKDSPSSKLLYAKDIPVYKEWVERYYSDIKVMPAISDQDMNAMLAEESRLHTTEFNTNCALYELYTYAGKYNEQLIVTLEEDEFSQKQRLAYKLEQVHNIMAADNP
ncbi:plexin-A4 [Colletes gigas]|uniref:plexin-A4 n=1 Tax=Colletes gigas TaxID=935657 RepID=UPI001C9B1E8C|nr:plexin-A4 [Colletes gigas]XP_043256481.1 plexin-A4 [Colletes gigas]XP_043256482.1 plexin-A4 [Colletes gigas]XP_043256483.1 plexin-A4 [Colletes gigas]XP_043256484.1 plexin-A4 [Colletes gigas]XP_043256485.1 plexin-A4 [Colletes gigas]